MLKVEDVRKALRISGDSLDDEITSTMAAAQFDLASGGMKDKTDNALVDMAVKLYARWQFDYCGKGPQYEAAYHDLKNVLALVYREDSGGDE